MSLVRGLYYANPRNQFWKIIGTLLDIPDAIKIQNAYQYVKERHIAIWDVIASREWQAGSMDHDIGDVDMNDIRGLLDMNPTIHFIGMNGGFAWACFLKITRMGCLPKDLVFRRLPSTSPANARYSLEEKIREWRLILEFTD